MLLLDGKKISNEIKQELISDYKKLKQPIVLTIIQVGDEHASNVYIRNKINFAKEIGYDVFLLKLPKEIEQKDLINEIKKQNLDPKITGILVQMPLPKNIDELTVIEAIDPKKDVDCFHPINVARLWTAKNLNHAIKPCTPAGIIELLERYNIDLLNKNVTIIGRSNIVGKPLAALMLSKNATVTICHSKTKNLQAIAKQSDILIVAIGRPNFIDHNYTNENQIVIDVGINRDSNNKLCGDVCYDDVANYVKMITPVPGGIGPMTIVMLMKNLLTLAKQNSQDC